MTATFCADAFGKFQMLWATYWSITCTSTTAEAKDDPPVELDMALASAVDPSVLLAWEPEVD